MKLGYLIKILRDEKRIYGDLDVVINNNVIDNSGQITVHNRINASESRLPYTIDKENNQIVFGSRENDNATLEAHNHSDEDCPGKLVRNKIVIGNIKVDNSNKVSVYSFDIQTWFDDGESYLGADSDGWFYFFAQYTPELDQWEFKYYKGRYYNFTDRISPEDRQLIIDMICEKLWLELEDVPFTERNCDIVMDTDFWAFWQSGTAQAEIWQWFDRYYSKNLQGLITACDRIGA
ncbi:hypothetical protein [Blautia producta]|uniref:hypothetical protein n=1 Tax=Blautia producta TaxID=33035 RepID=UPI00356ACB50